MPPKYVLDEGQPLMTLQKKSLSGLGGTLSASDRGQSLILMQGSDPYDGSQTRQSSPSPPQEEEGGAKEQTAGPGVQDPIQTRFSFQGPNPQDRLSLFQYRAPHIQNISYNRILRAGEGFSATGGVDYFQSLTRNIPSQTFSSGINKAIAARFSQTGGVAAPTTGGKQSLLESASTRPGSQLLRNASLAVHKEDTQNGIRGDLKDTVSKTPPHSTDIVTDMMEHTRNLKDRYTLVGSPMTKLQADFQQRQKSHHEDMIHLHYAAEKPEINEQMLTNEIRSSPRGSSTRLMSSRRRHSLSGAASPASPGTGGPATVTATPWKESAHREAAPGDTAHPLHDALENATPAISGEHMEDLSQWAEMDSQGREIALTSVSRSDGGNSILSQYQRPSKLKSHVVEKHGDDRAGGLPVTPTPSNYPMSDARDYAQSTDDERRSQPDRRTTTVSQDGIIMNRQKNKSLSYPKDQPEVERLSSTPNPSRKGVEEIARQPDELFLAVHGALRRADASKTSVSGENQIGTDLHQEKKQNDITGSPDLLGTAASPHSLKEGTHQDSKMSSDVGTPQYPTWASSSSSALFRPLEISKTLFPMPPLMRHGSQNLGILNNIWPTSATANCPPSLREGKNSLLHSQGVEKECCRDEPVNISDADDLAGSQQTENALSRGPFLLKQGALTLPHRTLSVPTIPNISLVHVGERQSGGGIIIDHVNEDRNPNAKTGTSNEKPTSSPAISANAGNEHSCVIPSSRQSKEQPSIQREEDLELNKFEGQPTSTILPRRRNLSIQPPSLRHLQCLESSPHLVRPEKPFFTSATSSAEILRTGRRSTVLVQPSSSPGGSPEGDARTAVDVDRQKSLMPDAPCRSDGEREAPSRSGSRSSSKKTMTPRSPQIIAVEEMDQTMPTAILSQQEDFLADLLDADHQGTIITTQQEDARWEDMSAQEQEDIFSHEQQPGKGKQTHINTESEITGMPSSGSIARMNSARNDPNVENQSDSRRRRRSARSQKDMKKTKTKSSRSFSTSNQTERVASRNRSASATHKRDRPLKTLLRSPSPSSQNRSQSRSGQVDVKNPRKQADAENLETWATRIQNEEPPHVLQGRRMSGHHNSTTEKRNSNKISTHKPPKLPNSAKKMDGTPSKQAIHRRTNDIILHSSPSNQSIDTETALTRRRSASNHNSRGSERCSSLSASKSAARITPYSSGDRTLQGSATSGPPETPERSSASARKFTDEVGASLNSLEATIPSGNAAVSAPPTTEGMMQILTSPLSLEQQHNHALLHSMKKRVSNRRATSTTSSAEGASNLLHQEPEEAESRPSEDFPEWIVDDVKEKDVSLALGTEVTASDITGKEIQRSNRNSIDINIPKLPLRSSFLQKTPSQPSLLLDAADSQKVQTGGLKNVHSESNGTILSSSAINTATNVATPKILDGVFRFRSADSLHKIQTSTLKTSSSTKSFQK